MKVILEPQSGCLFNDGRHDWELNSINDKNNIEMPVIWCSSCGKIIKLKI